MKGRGMHELTTITMEHLVSTLDLRETLFTTNQLPSAEELKIVDSTLAQLRAEHSQLTLRLARIEAMLPHLESVRHPVRYVPDDILGRVFEYVAPSCFAGGVEEESFPSPYYAATPWMLSHVCRNWRAVCLSLPHLWSTFCLDFSSIRIPWPVFAEKMDAIYQRSNPLPLRVHIRNYKSDHALPHLLKASHRWSWVRFTSDSRHKSSHVDVFHDHLFPHLAHLELEPLPHSRPAHIMAPRLRKLELRQAGIDCGLVLPWDQITQYTSTDTDLEFIGYMKNLEKVIVDEKHAPKYKYLSVSQGMERTILPKVRHFEYNDSFEYDDYDEENAPPHGRLDWLFIQYHFPSLHTLYISDFYRSGENFPFSLPSVVELSLQYLPANDIRNILLATPNLQSLSRAMIGMRIPC